MHNHFMEELPGGDKEGFGWDILINLINEEGLWQEVIRKKDMFLERGVFSVNNGRDIRFWEDRCPLNVSFRGGLVGVNLQNWYNLILPADLAVPFSQCTSFPHIQLLVLYMFSSFISVKRLTGVVSLLESILDRAFAIKLETEHPYSSGLKRRKGLDSNLTEVFVLNSWDGLDKDHKPLLLGQQVFDLLWIQHMEKRCYLCCLVKRFLIAQASTIVFLKRQFGKLGG
ncbi:hypothetical protein ACJX0J_042400 [Zea mays]